MTQRTKKWGKFIIRWTIAVVGIGWVVLNTPLYDRVTIVDPANNRPVKVTLAEDTPDKVPASVKIVDPVTGGTRVVTKDELVNPPDAKWVKVRHEGGAQKRRLLAMQLSDDLKSVQRLLVEKPDGTGEWLKPNRLAAFKLNVPYPLVDQGIVPMVRRADRGYLWAAVFIFPLTHLITSFRWHKLLSAIGINMGPARAFVINMVGAFYNTFMPGSTGGDVLKAYYAAKVAPEHRTRAVMSVIVDRIIGLLALIILGGAMAAKIALAPHEPEDPVAARCAQVAIGAAVLIAVTIVGLSVLYNPFLRRVTGFDFILKRLPMQAQVNKALHTLELYRRRPGLVLAMLIMTFPVHITVIFSAMCAGMAFGLPLTPGYYWVVVPVIVLAGSIPISPQGAGVMEFFAILLTSRQGCTVSQAFALTMSIRLVQIFWNLWGGIAVMRGGYHAPTQKEQESIEGDDSGGAAPSAPAPAQAVMLKKIDRILIRVPQLASAVKYYRDVLGLRVIRHSGSVATLRFAEQDTELVLHDDADLPDNAAYYLVDDVRDLFRRRDSLRLKFAGPPVQVAKGFRATAKDPFGNVLLLLDRSTETGAATSMIVEDAKPPGALFAGVDPKLAVKADTLAPIYESIGRTADDLPYTPHFESLYSSYAGHFDTKPTRQEVWRHLLNLRKAGKLPKLGDARSKPPKVDPEDEQTLRDLLGKDIGKRDRLPYTDRFDKLVNEFNTTKPRKLSPHLVWRIVARLAK